MQYFKYSASLEFLLEHVWKKQVSLLVKLYNLFKHKHVPHAREIFTLMRILETF